MGTTTRNLSLRRTALAVLALAGLAAAVVGVRATRAESDAQAAPARVPPSPVSPETEIAVGTEGGEPWSLRAYTAEVGAEATPALCVGWAFPAQAPADFNCYVGVQDTLAGNDALVIYDSNYGEPGDPGMSAVLGLSPSTTGSVDIRLVGGGSSLAQIYAAPDSLGVNGDFFVGFFPASASVTVAASDGKGAPLWERDRTALPVLTVTKSGNGTGTVLGYIPHTLTCEGDQCPPPDREWIDCGEDCVSAIDNGSIILVAVPDDGSSFAGWGGDCAGQGDCTLKVDSGKSVEAEFASS